MNLFSLIFLLFLILFLYKFVFKTIVVYLAYKKRYGDQILVKFYPFLGYFYFINDSLKQYGHSYKFLFDLQKNHPKVKAVLYLSGNNQFLMLLNEDWIKSFIQEVNNFEKLNYLFAVSIMFNDGLLFSFGDQWKSQRHFLNKIFNFNSIKDMVEGMKQSSEYFLEVEKNLDQFQKINLLKQIKYVTTISTKNSFFGMKEQLQASNGKPFYEELNDLLDQLYIHTFTKYFLIKSFIFGAQKATLIFQSKKEKKFIERVNNLKEISLRCIEKRKEQLNQINIQEFEAKTIIDIYLKEQIIEEKNGLKQINKKNCLDLSNEIIMNQFFTFFSAGTETTSINTTMVLYYLSIYPDIKEKVLTEMNKNIPSSFKELTFEHINSLNYLTKCIKEVLRLHPPFQLLIPRYIKTQSKLGDLILDKGLYVAPTLINSYKFKNYYQFDPDRFDEVGSFNTFDYIPFSSGQRNCIGQHFAIIQSKIMIVSILQNYDIKPVENYQLRMKAKISTIPEDPYLIMLRKKQQ